MAEPTFEASVTLYEGPEVVLRASLQPVEVVFSARPEDAKLVIPYSFLKALSGAPGLTGEDAVQMRLPGVDWSGS